MLLMGDYEILFSFILRTWQLNDRLNPSSPGTFDSLEDLLDYIRTEQAKIYETLYPELNNAR